MTFPSSHLYNIHQRMYSANSFIRHRTYCTYTYVFIYNPLHWRWWFSTKAAFAICTHLSSSAHYSPPSMVTTSGGIGGSSIRVVVIIVSTVCRTEENGFHCIHSIRNSVVVVIDIAVQVRHDLTTHTNLTFADCVQLVQLYTNRNPLWTTSGSIWKVFNFTGLLIL